jgi:capsular polysaccharide biosynthesis protein
MRNVDTLRSGIGMLPSVAEAWDGGGGFGSAVRRWWWLVLAATVVAAATAAAVATQVSPTYEARVQLLVGPVSGDRDTLEAAAQLAPTYAALAVSHPVVDLANRALDLDTGTEELRDGVTAVGSTDTRLVTVTARHTEAVAAARIADTVAESLVTRSSALPGPAEGAGTPLTVVAPAQVPEAPVAPRLPLVVALAATGAATLALALAFAAERSRDAVEGIDDLGPAAPALGVLARRSLDGSGRAAVVVEAAPHTRLAAAYRVAAAKVELLAVERSARRVLVAAAGPDAPGVDVAVNLAAALGESGVPVTLVDATADGAASRLVGAGSAPVGDGAGVAVGLAGVRLVDATDRAHVGDDPLRAGTGEDVAGITVVAAEPVGSSAASLTWARRCDVVLLAVRTGRSRRSDVTAAADALVTVGANLAGALLTAGAAPRRLRRRQGAPAADEGGEPVGPPPRSAAGAQRTGA